MESDCSSTATLLFVVDEIRGYNSLPGSSSLQGIELTFRVNFFIGIDLLSLFNDLCCVKNCESITCYY